MYLLQALEKMPGTSEASEKCLECECVDDSLSVSLRTQLSCLNSQGKQNIKVDVDLEI